MVDPEEPQDQNLHYTTAAAVGPEHARATWALAARERLIETAKEYHASVDARQLADFVQRRSLIRTSSQHWHWLGDVLARVDADCAQRGEPLLSALCVDAQGRVAPGYPVAVEIHRGEVVEDADEHAAHERLECHRRWGATLPAGGGEPSRLQPEPAARATSSGRTGSGRSTATRSASARSTAARSTPTRSTAAARASTKPAEKPLVTCPVHFTVLPASGICDLCD
jgi:hypothetical protein